jgi:hypothetical protein
MYRYDTHLMQDDQINQILQCLFYSTYIDENTLKTTIQILRELDLASTYLLFALIQEKLPKRAKLFFAGESFEGKKEMIYEVMQTLYVKK